MPVVLAGPETQRLIGRERELELLVPLLDPDPACPVAFIHGPGGIGKTSLLRELARRAEARELRVWRVDGRDQDTAHDATRAALAELREPALLVLDTYERVAALGAVLRRDLDACVAAGVRVAIAGRRPPEAGWRHPPWRDRIRTVELTPLSIDEARAVVRRRGVVDDEAVERLAAWSDGSPLPLTVAADAIAAGHPLDLARLDADEVLATTILRRLAGPQLHGADREVLAVAAIAYAVDARLLAAVLPGMNGTDAEAWLQSLSFAEPLGTRVTLHERVREAIRAALRTQDPFLAGSLRRRIADHIYARAALGESQLIVDLAELFDDPAFRWGAAPPARDVTADWPRPGDAERIADLLGANDAAWWPGTRRWFLECPERVYVIRDAAGAIAGYGITVTPANAPEWAGEDAVLGPWLADVRRRPPGGEAILLREFTDLIGAPAVVSASCYIQVVRARLPTIRYSYAAVEPDNEPALDFVRALGYVHRPELDVDVAGRRTLCFFVDWGPAGLVGALRDLVYRDVGAPPPEPVPPAQLAASAVRDVLRGFHDPIALAASPLAMGATTEERAAMVRRLVREAVDAAFGDSVDEQLQRATLERGYLDADGGHARAALDLRLGRTTYFRRLADAADRVTAYILASRA